MIVSFKYDILALISSVLSTQDFTPDDAVDNRDHCLAFDKLDGAAANVHILSTSMFRSAVDCILVVFIFIPSMPASAIIYPQLFIVLKPTPTCRCGRDSASCK